MSDRVSEAFFVAGAVAFVSAGGLHALGALVDTRRPTFFKPADEHVIPVMEGTEMQLRAWFPGARPERQNSWRAWLGFNISHGIGAALFGVMLLLVATHDYGLVEDIGAIRPLSIGVGLAYFILSVRFWFYLPAVATGLGTACFVIAALA